VREVTRDREMLTRLAPAVVEAYLRGTGWEMVDVEEGRASYWRRTDQRSGEEFEAFCVLDPTFRDFPQRMSELLQTVGSAEQRSPNDIYASITTAAYSEEGLLELIARQILSLPLEDKIAAITNALVQEAMNQAEGNIREAARRPGRHPRFVERFLMKPPRSPK
jgi:hypothetical protein